MYFSTFGSAGNGATTNFFSAPGGISGVHVNGNVVVTDGKRVVVHDHEKPSFERNSVIELHVHSPNDFDWNVLKNHSIPNVTVYGNVKGDIKNSVNVSLNGNLNGNIQNAVNVTTTTNQK